MKNYALLDDNNFVINISVADNDWDSTGWIEYTNDNPATINGDYFEGFFYPIKPFQSWIRNNGVWEAPVEYPNDGNRYTWDEDAGNWVLIAQ